MSTTSAAELDERRWQDRRLASWALRAAAVLAPILAAFVVVRAYLAIVDPPTLMLAQVVYWGGAFIVCAGTGVAVDRWSRRLLPIALRYRMSLVFPGEAPSRARLALDQATSMGPQHQLDAGAITDDGDAARHLLSLVGRLSDHDRVTRGHSERVQAYAELIGEQMGLSGPELDRLRWGALIHDIAKLAVPPDVLNTPGRPSDEEWKVIRNHPRAAEAYASALSGWLGTWSRAATHHHERWDGTGYPDGLAGDEISLAGRIVAVADAYDAMTSPGRFQRTLSPTAAREELARAAGSQFDPAVVRAMLNVPTQRLRLVLGPLAWLNELTWVARIPHAAATTAAGAAGAAVLTLAAAMVAPTVVDPPAAVSLERVVDETDEVEQEQEPATTRVTTTTAPTPTTTTLAPTAAAPLPSGLTGAGFLYVDPATLPPALDDGALTSDTHVFVWQEPARTLDTPLVVRAFGDGVPFAGDSAAISTISAGTGVCSYVLHSDPGTDVPDFDVRLAVGTVPLGFALQPPDLAASQPAQTLGVDHAYDGLDPDDEATVAGTEIRFRLQNDGGRDQVRIIVPC